jgi:hypothetical protein
MPRARDLFLSYNRRARRWPFGGGLHVGLLRLLSHVIVVAVSATAAVIY